MTRDIKTVQFLGRQLIIQMNISPPPTGSNKRNKKAACSR
jgi:hypothetical protein